MNLNIKVRGENKKEISKILIGLIILNIIVSIITIIFVNNEILKTIILYLISIIYIGITIYIIKKVNEKPILTKKEKFENKYDPILTRFFIKNEFELDDTLLNAEIYYFIKKGYVTIDKNNNILKLNNREQFKPIPPLEQINNNKIAECSTEEIPSYESMFINKILFAFHDEIQINEFNKNIKENYYHQRGELCKLAMEKMILFEIEKSRADATFCFSMNRFMQPGMRKSTGRISTMPRPMPGWNSLPNITKSADSLKRTVIPP